MKSIKEIKEIAVAWENLYKELRWFGYGSSALIKRCEILEALGEEWDYQIPSDFRVIKGASLCNKTTNYKFGKDKYYIHWDNGNVGRLQFVSERHYNEVKEEWDEFNKILNSYNPLDYDSMNCHKVYDIEQGKKLMNDYRDICRQTEEKMQEKIKTSEIRNLEKKLAQLKGQE